MPDRHCRHPRRVTVAKWPIRLGKQHHFAAARVAQLISAKIQEITSHMWGASKWDFDPRALEVTNNLLKGHVNSPSRKGHKELPGLGGDSFFVNLPKPTIRGNHLWFLWPILPNGSSTPKPVDYSPRLGAGKGPPFQLLILLIGHAPTNQLFLLKIKIRHRSWQFGDKKTFQSGASSKRL